MAIVEGETLRFVFFGRSTSTRRGCCTGSGAAADRSEFGGDGFEFLANDSANVVLRRHVRDVFFGRHHLSEVEDVFGKGGEFFIGRCEAFGNNRGKTVERHLFCDYAIIA